MSLGFGQIAILLLIILILFGAGKLPKVMKDLSKGMKAFKEGLNDDEESEKESLSHTAEEESPSIVTSHQKTAAHKKAS